MQRKLELEISAQPDDSTCGPTCLHAVYRYYGDTVSLEEVIRGVATLRAGGTLAVQLACHALDRGYRATIYTYNLVLFDPTWFTSPHVDLSERLRLQATAKGDRKLREATSAYLRFLAQGGVIRFEELTAQLLLGHLDEDRPILTGMSATYLYRCAREYGEEELEYDDVRGMPTGHFVILCGHDRQTDRVLVADPLQDNPRYGSRYYEVGIERVLGAVLLGVLTYDANLLILEPPDGGTAP